MYLNNTYDLLGEIVAEDDHITVVKAPAKIFYLDLLDPDEDDFDIVVAQQQYLIDALPGCSLKIMEIRNTAITAMSMPCDEALTSYANFVAACADEVPTPTKIEPIVDKPIEPGKSGVKVVDFKKRKAPKTQG